MSENEEKKETAAEEQKENSSEEKVEASTEDPKESPVEAKPIITIEISQDKYDAYLTVNFPGESKALSPAKIRSDLNEKGVVNGINDDILKSLEDNTQEISKMLVASGERPIDGENGKIKLLIDPPEKGKALIVKRQERLARIEPPVEGKDGMNLMGEKRSFRPGKKLEASSFENVEKLKDEPAVLISVCEGYVEHSDERVIVKPFFAIEISGDALEVWVTVQKPRNEGDFGKDNLIDFLKGNEINYGIIEKLLDDIFVENKYEEKILIAKGKKLKNGKDGFLKFYFETHVGPTEDEKGNVDHKELNLIQNVSKGDKLVEIKPPTEGEKGITIKKEDISPNPGKPVKDAKLTNAIIDPKDPKFIIADLDGHVIRRGNAIIVDPVFTIKEDVDYSTGNVDCDSSVFVNGNVKSGFGIKSKNDIEINGFVEDAVIEAGGNVMMKSGFSGRGEGKVEAGGKIIAQFCENQTVISKADISFCEYIMRCNVVSHGKVVVTEQKGLIIGGEIFAQLGVEANVIGNQSYTPTEIITGINKDAQDSYEEKKAELSEIREKKDSVEKAIDSLLAKKAANKKLPDDKKALLEKIRLAKEQLIEQEEGLLSEMKKLRDELGKYKDSVVIVHGTVFPNTKITIFDKVLSVNEEAENSVFKYTEEGIVLEKGN